VNRYGLSWGEVTPDNLQLVDSEGRLLEGEGPVMTAAFVIHAQVHSIHGSDARVVFHTHQTAATALGCISHPQNWREQNPGMGQTHLTGLPHMTATDTDTDTDTDTGLGRLAPILLAHFNPRSCLDPEYTGIANDLDEGRRIANAMVSADGGPCKRVLLMGTCNIYIHTLHV
jgi:hypothetical protein